MAKRRVKRSSGTKKRLYRTETYGIKYNSLTFLLFLVFVLVIAMVLVARMLGMGSY